jgi:hypothetical protein
MPEGTKNMEYLYSNIQNGRSPKIARKAYENIKILTLTMFNSEQKRLKQRRQLPSTSVIILMAPHELAVAYRLHVGALLALASSP